MFQDYKEPYPQIITLNISAAGFSSVDTEVSGSRLGYVFDFGWCFLRMQYLPISQERGPLEASLM